MRAAQFPRIIGIVIICFLGTAIAFNSSSYSQNRTQQTTARSGPTAATPPKTDEKIQLETLQRHIDLIEGADNVLDYLRYDQRDCVECHAGIAGQTRLDSRSPSEICQKTWESFYSKAEIDIRVVFGYYDASFERTVDDVISRQALIDKLTQPCNSNVAVCGFKRSIEDADVLIKEVRGPKGNIHKVNLRIVASAYSPSDRLNRALAKDQKEKSDLAKRIFLSGIEEADALFYIGHARDGGGPDFSPARLKNGAIDYQFYRQNKPGLEELTSRISLAKKTPKIMGFLACNSERWHERLRRMAPRSGLLLSETENIAHEVALVQTFGALDSILWQRCENSFNEALNPIPGGAYAGTVVKRINIRNFFN
jgi:hypothetical protein